MGLVGESGSGKTLTGLSIIQLIPETALVNNQSQIIYQGNNILNYTEKKMRQIRARQVGMIFQDAMSAFNPVYTIGNQLMERLNRVEQFSRKSQKNKAYHLLNEVGIDEAERCFHAYPHQLSGGQRQRAMIAMALGGSPDLLIADEPTTALDVTIQAQILKLLKNLQKKHNMSLLFISHDLAVVSELSDRMVVMRQGHKIEEDKTDVFFKHPKSDYSRMFDQSYLFHHRIMCLYG